MKIIILATILVFLNIACQNTANNTSAGIDPQTDSAVTSASDQPKEDSASKEENGSSNDLIIPGKQIGKTQIGDDPETLVKNLGKPDSSDAAMGKAWLFWNGKRDEHNNKTLLAVYTTYKDNTMKEKIVKLIYSTSSFFKTSNGVGVYSDLGEIKKQFHGLQQVAQFKEHNSERMIHIYTDKNQGIAFETAEARDQQICIAVTVYIPNENLLDLYIPLHSEIQK
jgi:hypothetical protein